MSSRNERVLQLESEIRRHKILYYQGSPEISDSQFDKLEDELRKLDPQNSALALVGTNQLSATKIQHTVKMLSLNKTYKTSELESWIGEHTCVSMFKIDGVSCSLVYKKGILTMAKTRGDGSFGENILDKILWLGCVPGRISDLDEVEVRGELYCTEKDFFHLSDEMVKRGLDKPTSQRNIVAGLMGRKDNIDLARFLTFQAFDYITDSLAVSTEQAKFKRLRKEKFLTPEIVVHKNKSQLKDVIDEAREFMSSGDYQIDGLVFAYDDLYLQEELGSTAHHPRFKMAFKFQGESKVTQIEQIEWNVSRNGILTPVAHVDPVELSHAMISRVTLHNFGMVRQFNLKSGDEIEIVRSGEVIPKFISVVNSSKGDYSYPSACPSCEQNLRIDDIRLVCFNSACPAQIKNIILNFIQKIGIDDLSSKRLDEMIRVGLVKDISSLYKLKKEDFLKLDKVKEKLATKLYESIQKSKTVDFVDLLSSIGISSGGNSKCEKVIHAGYDSLEKLKELSYEDLAEVESFAQKSAEEFLTSLREKFPLLENLGKLGFKLKSASQVGTGVLSGKKICITGSLSVKRSVMEKMIREAGGQPVSSVSKNTDYLLTNETDPSSSKYKKAMQLNIKVLTEKEIGALLN